MASEYDDVLAVNDLSVSFAAKKVLQQVSFSLKPGEFCGLIALTAQVKPRYYVPFSVFRPPTKVA